MAKKVVNPIEIDFDEGTCSESFESKLSFVCDQTKRLINPYIGNKKKMLYHIFSYLQDYVENSDAIFWDVFSGSHSVSIAAKLLGKKVYCSDVLISSYLYGLAFVENDQININKEDFINLLFDEVEEKYDFLNKYKERFSEQEIEKISNFISNINKLISEGCSKYKIALFISLFQLYIMSRCFVGGRLNQGQILAEKEHRINHDRNAGSEMPFNDIKILDFNCGNSHCEAFCGDAVVLAEKFQIEQKNIEIAYIDPPYGGQQSDYESMFSFFEDLCLNTELDIVTHDSGNIGNKRFIKSSSYAQNFTEFLEKIYWIPKLAISYNDSSWSKLENIIAIVGRFKGRVKVEEIEYSYKYRSEKNRTGKEYLIFAE
jgi:adenine-specific DNA methylase